MFYVMKVVIFYMIINTAQTDRYVIDVDCIHPGDRTDAIIAHAFIRRLHSFLDRLQHDLSTRRDLFMFWFVV